MSDTPSDKVTWFRTRQVETKTFAGDGLRCDFGSCGVVYRTDRL